MNNSQGRQIEPYENIIKYMASRYMVIGVPGSVLEIF